MAHFDYLESDFIDVSEIQPLDVEELSDDEEEVIEPRRRGKDIDWQEYLLLDGPNDYNNSIVLKELKEVMMKKKEWNNRESRNQNFVCKYASKRGWKYCPRQYKVCFLHKVMNIMIYCVNNSFVCHVMQDTVNLGEQNIT